MEVCEWRIRLENWKWKCVNEGKDHLYLQSEFNNFSGFLLIFFGFLQIKMTEIEWMNRMLPRGHQAVGANCVRTATVVAQRTGRYKPCGLQHGWCRLDRPVGDLIRSASQSYHPALRLEGSTPIVWAVMLAVNTAPIDTGPRNHACMLAIVEISWIVRLRPVDCACDCAKHCFRLLFIEWSLNKRCDK